MGIIDTSEKKKGPPVEVVPKAKAEPAPTTSIAPALRPAGAVDQWWTSQDKIDLIKRTIAVGSSNDELALFVEVARATGLNPFARQIYAVKRWNSNAGREVMTIQTGIDGYRLIAERTDRYAGRGPVEWCGNDGQWAEVWLRDVPPVAARATVFRKDFVDDKGVQRPVVAIAKWTSYCQTNKAGEPTAMWKRYPDLMLGKCAEALALRTAFPQELSGIYTAEEMAQADSEDQARPAPRPVSRQDVVEGTRAASESKGAEGPLPEAEKEGRPRDANRTGYADAALDLAKRQAESARPMTEEHQAAIRAQVKVLREQKHPVLRKGLAEFMDAKAKGTWAYLWQHDELYDEIADILGVPAAPPSTPAQDPDAQRFNPDAEP